MLTKKQLLAFTAISLTIFAFNATIRQDMVGADNYAFANAVCNGKQLPENTPILAATIFSLLPCSIPLFKLLPAFLMLSCMIAVALTGNLYDKKHGWLAGFFLLLAPLFAGMFLTLEDDQFAFPILFLALYFFAKAKMQGKRVNELYALALIGFAALFWKGSILYAIAFSANSILFLLLSTPISLLFGQQIMISLLPNLSVQENLPLLAFGGWLFAFIGMLALPKKLKWIAILWVLLGTANAKFAFHAIPFLAIGAMQLHSGIEKRFPLDFDRQKVFQYGLTALALSTLIVIPITVFKAEPVADKLTAIKYAINYAQQNGKELKNDWDLGYWIEWHGGKASAKGGITQQDYSSGVILTRQQLPCQLAKEFGNMKVYDC